MDFQNWLIKEESQVDNIVEEIAKKFDIGGMPIADKLKFQLSNLEPEQKNNGEMEVPISVKTSLEALGPIRTMTPEQKTKFDDMMKDLPLSTSLGDLAQRIVSIISGEQKEV